MRRVLIVAALLSLVTSVASAQYGPRIYDEDGYRPPPPPIYRPGYRPQGGFDPYYRERRGFVPGMLPPPLRCFTVYDEYGPRRVCRRGPPRYY